MNSLNSIIKFVVKMLICLVCTVSRSIILPSFMNALKFNSNLNIQNETNERLSNIIPLLSSFSSLCFVAENKDHLDVFVKYLKVKDKPLNLVELGKLVTDDCESIVLIDINTTSDCENIVFKTYKHPLTFFNVFKIVNLTELEKCVCDSPSSEVVSVYLQQSLLLELSPISHSPRSFIKSTVENVVEHRMRSKLEDFRGMNVTGAFVEYPPFAVIEHTSDNFDGIEVILFQELSQKLNFTPRYLVYNEWGKVTPDGNYENGLSGAMREGKIDIATGCIYQIRHMHSIMDYLPSLTMAQISFIIRRPEKINFELKNFISIFKPSVWNATVGSYIMIMALYWYGIIRGIPSYKEDWTCSALMIFGRFTMTTSHDYFTSTFNRFILTSWSVSSLLLTTLLSSGIVCSLTLPIYSPRVDTFKQLVEGGYYWTGQYYCDIDNEEMKETMFYSEDHWNKDFEKLYRYMDAGEIEAKAYIDKKLTFVSQIYDNDLVIIDVDELSGNNLRSFRATRLDAIKFHVSFGVKKNSPLFEPLAKITTRILEAGLLQQWRSAVLHRWPLFDTRHMMEEYDEPNFGEPEVMPLHKLEPVFYVLLAGLAASLVVFFIEIAFIR